MKEGDILLAALLQADGTLKNRPVLFLRKMPPFQDFLVCGLSQQLQHEVKGLDEIIITMDSDFASSRLKAASLIRLGFLAVPPPTSFKGRIGSVSAIRSRRLLVNLSDFLRPK